MNLMLKEINRVVDQIKEETERMKVWQHLITNEELPAFKRKIRKRLFHLKQLKKIVLYYQEEKQEEGSE